MRGSSENATTGTPVGRTAIDAARRLLLPRTIASDDFNDLIESCQQHNADVAVVAESLPELLAALLDEVRLMRYEGREPAEATVEAIRKAGGKT